MLLTRWGAFSGMKQQQKYGGGLPLPGGGPGPGARRGRARQRIKRELGRQNLRFAGAFGVTEAHHAGFVWEFRGGSLARSVLCDPKHSEPGACNKGSWLQTSLGRFSFLGCIKQRALLDRFGGSDHSCLASHNRLRLYIFFATEWTFCLPKKRY